MDIPEAVQGMEKTAWRPLTIPDDGQLDSSKFGGRPWMAQDEPWPLCGYCGHPLQFIAQINLCAVPEEVRDTFGDGLLQLFYCTNSDPLCEVEREGWEPFSEGALVRVVDPVGPSAAVVMPEFEESFPSRLVVDWIRSADYPAWCELYDLLSLPDSVGEILEARGFPHRGDKLGG